MSEPTVKKLLKIGIATAVLFAAPALSSAANADFYASSFVGIANQQNQASSGAGERTAIDFDDGFVIGGAIGYRFSAPAVGGLRVELELAYRENNVNAGTLLSDPTVAFDGDNSSLGAFGNVFYEFGNIPFVTPYVGAGIGIGGVESDVVRRNAIDDLRFGGATRTELLYQGIIGLTVPLGDTWEVFGEGRYYVAPGAEFDLIDTALNTRQTLESNYEVLQLQAGLRYKF